MTHILNKSINGLLVLAIVSSFFIMKNIPIQLYNIFLGIALILVAIDILISRKHLEKVKGILKPYALITSLLFAFILIGVAANSYIGNRFNFSVGVELGRIVVVLLSFLIVIYQGTKGKGFIRSAYAAFFAPLILTPLLLFRNIGKVKALLPSDFFSLYSLQALQYNPTSLTAFLVVPLAFSVAGIFSLKSSGYIRLASITSSVLFTSFILWTRSRAGIIALIAVWTITLYLANKKTRWHPAKTIPLFLIITTLGFLILPQLAQVNLLARFYPEQITDEDLATLPLEINELIGTVIGASELPDFTNAQERQVLWPSYSLFLLKNPLGYGPGYRDWVPAAIGMRTAPHNTLLHVGLWGGWGAILTFTWLLIKIYRTGTKAIQKLPYDYLVVGLESAFLAVLIPVMLNDFFLLKQLWILAALILSYAYLSNVKPEEISLLRAFKKNLKKVFVAS